MNRRNILIELARAKLLTPERSDYVRTAFERDVRASLLLWKVSPAVLEAADIPVIAPHSRPRYAEKNIQRQVDLHLTALGFDPVPVRVCTLREATARSYDHDWLDHLRQDELDLYNAAWRFPPTVTRILYRAQDPIWQPLVDLIIHRVHPYGLAITRDHFKIVYPDAD